LKLMNIFFHFHSVFRSYTAQEADKIKIHYDVARGRGNKEGFVWYNC
jgi:hypothetical protein